MMNEQDKFRTNKAGTVLCFYAGGADCETQARDIVISCRPGEDEAQWEMDLYEATKRSRVAGSDLLNEHLVIRRDIRDAVWLVKSYAFGLTYVSKLTDRTSTGNNAPAKFLMIHLWNPDRPVAELKQLALLTLAYAEKENPSTVGGGFDVMVLNGRHQFEWSHYRSLEEIVARFNGKLRAAFDELEQPVTKN